jgi:chromate reductase, NAD(P)H dehydrogenase (quinone)
MHFHALASFPDAVRLSAKPTRRPATKGHPMATPHNVVVIAGSLRKESFTLKIANALAKLAPATLKLDVTTLHDISFFNQDLEATPPADWLAFREKLQKSNGVLFVTPEYNRAIPGVLKNAIDVGSRPYGKSSFLGKPTGIVSNSPGPLGGVNAAKALQNILPGISGPIMGQPETYLNAVGDAFDDKGLLTKEALQKVLQQFIDAFAAFVEKQNR